MKNKYELIIVGGGFAGVAAAISAARRGVDVLLIEKYNCLGGAAVSQLVLPFMPYWTQMPVTLDRKFLCGSLFLEIFEEMNKLTDAEGKEGFNKLLYFDEEILKLVLNRMAIKSGVTLLFNTTVTEAAVENGFIKSIKALGKSKVLELEADTFIDATGDGELSMLAGCSYKLGREKDSLCQPMTLCFRMSGVDRDKYRKNEKRINELYKELREKGVIKNPRENILVFYNYNDNVLHFNTTRVVKKNPTDPFDVTEAEIEAREQVFELLSFLKNNFDGFENARILSTAMQIGIRESRKIEGEYTISVDDLMSLARFDDAIAVSNYSIDIHSPDGTGTYQWYFGDGEWYEIPYRCLIPKGMNNLLVAGRCISSTHEAQASFRVMPYCSEIGQAAGIAVSVAKKNATSVRDVDIKEVQKILISEDFAINS
ncbi:MAG: FAD-dependent oxidoreductase [Clostridia bacterium]|nr:FAD-dependent oxidoreductase [Clostridia bacterium]